MSKKKGFTLIELLVVIAIIALLLSIVMPALRKVKESAKSLQCQTNLRGLVAAWYTYSTDNDEQLCGSWNYSPSNGWGEKWDWAWAPWELNGGTAVSDYWNASIEERQEGIRKGTLFPYVNTFDSYHCPSDESAGGNFRSYSMPDCLNGIWGNWAPWENLKKISQIRSPGDKYVFLEENDSRGYNINAWVIDPAQGTNSDVWADPMVVWHFSHSNLAFADGHTEEWDWSDETVEFFIDFESFVSGYRPVTPEGIKDLKRVHRGWAE